MKGEIHEIPVLDVPGCIGWLCQFQTGKGAEW